MPSTLGRALNDSLRAHSPTGKHLASILRESSRLVPYVCRYLVHTDARIRYVAADALYRISRHHADAIERNLDRILPGLKYQDARTRIRLLRAIVHAIAEYPVRIERYLATISYCLYTPDNSALRTAAAACLAQLAALDERRNALYMPMLLQCIGKYRHDLDTAHVVRLLVSPLRVHGSRRFFKRIRELLLPLRRKGTTAYRKTLRRVLTLTEY